MEKQIKNAYLNILHKELVPAMGCTEPIAVAYCATIASSKLGVKPEKVVVKASANIIKNVKSVVVPNTDGHRGIASAAAAGIIANAPESELQVLANITKDQISQIADFLESAEFEIGKSEKEYIFNIQVTVKAGNHEAYAEIAGTHTNVIEIRKDGEVLYSKDYQEEKNDDSDYESLTIEKIIDFADNVDIDEVKEVIGRQIEYNTAIAKEALSGNYGANIGKILLKSYGDSVHNRAKAYAAAGSDGRMNGCELPVVINSGSGNQGLTASLPVIVYAKELEVSEEKLYRALIVSNLVTIHLKSGIGRLSAYCGATSAGCGAGAGISYLYGGRRREIAHTIVNALAINSGMICDGAKASCAAKIASAVEAGLLGVQMQNHDSQFYDGDGIVVKGVENTIRNVGTVAREGMSETDKIIIKLMTER